MYVYRLGHGIKVASLEEVGPGGSWSKCCIHNMYTILTRIVVSNNVIVEILY